MPVIDAYNSLWRSDGRLDAMLGEGYGVEKMLAHMDAAGVKLAVACSPGQQIDNEYIAECQASYPDRIIGFALVNPRSPGAVEEIRHCAIKLGLRGLALHPTLHGYHFVDHATLNPIFTVCGELGLPILVSALDDPFVTPLGIEEIARGFPRTSVVVAHAGTVWNVAEALLVVGRNENIYAETSATRLLDVQLAYRQVGPQKLLMGTGWPGSDFDLERLKLRKAIPSQPDRALVEGGNLARLLGIASH